jgi:hypothetical protein
MLAFRRSRVISFRRDFEGNLMQIDKVLFRTGWFVLGVLIVSLVAMLVMTNGKADLFGVRMPIGAAIIIGFLSWALRREPDRRE